MSLNQPKSIRKIIFCSLDGIWDLFESHERVSNGFSEVWGYPSGTSKLFCSEGPKIGAHFNVSCSTGSYVLQSAQNSLITLRIGPSGSPDSKMACYVKISPFLAEKWRIDGDRK